MYISRRLLSDNGFSYVKDTNPWKETLHGDGRVVAREDLLFFSLPRDKASVEGTKERQFYILAGISGHLSPNSLLPS